MLGAVTALMPGVAAAAPLGDRDAAQAKPGSATVTSAGAVPVPASWSYTADVVVVGYGGSGAISAISAHDAGANVIVLEKTPSYAQLGVANPPISGGGGSTCMNAGGCSYVTDPVAAANYIYQTCWGNTPLSVCQALAWMETDTPSWLTQMGVKFTTPAPAAPEFPALGATGMASFSLTGGGHQWFQSLDGQVQARNIQVLFNTPATDLIQDPTTKKILGVRALANSSQVLNIKANKGVILCTGSFEYNEQMKSDYLRTYPLHGSGWQFCTGDGVKMASKVGAAMWHMGICSLNMAAWFPDYPIAFGGSSPSEHGYIYVDRYGNRWGNETLLGFGAGAHTWNFWLKLSDFDFNLPGYTRIPTFVIFDEAARKAGPVSSGSSGVLPTYLDPRPKWSSDNTAEIAKGWIQQGADIPTLVQAMNAKTYVGVPPGSGVGGPSAAINVNINPATLMATVNNWNQMCATGADTQFGRAASTMAPISTPPYYSMPLWPGGPSLYGGPVRNERGQICDVDGNPIPHLYGAGESGNVTGGLLDITTNNGQMVACGRVAGANAASETS